MNATTTLPPGACILVIDDTPANLAVAVDHLEAHGLRVLVAQDGEEGLERARFAAPDLILLDVTMPGIDGFETCRRLKADPATRAIPVIFMTALAATPDKLAGFEAGGVDYLTKPFSAAEMLARISVHLALAVAQRELARRNDALQHEVAERRRAQEALQQAYDALQLTNARLEDARGQLLESEKMAAIGILAAGVAHEINNPIGFVASNLSSLQQYVADLLGLTARYEAVEPALAQLSAPGLDEIRRAREAAELDFLRQDVVKLFAESRDGLQRVKNIVDQLRDFSLAGTGQWQLADVHASIDATLQILADEIGDKIEVVRDYGHLPELECRPAALTQVFVNVLRNAVQSMPVGGRIHIRSELRDGQAWIEIADSGVGIGADRLSRIFDPFYTTRPVGDGTGLGLFVAYTMVQQHRGRIAVDSAAGRGTTVRIGLPLRRMAG